MEKLITRRSSYFYFLFLLLILILMQADLFGQGVTTSAMNGLVTDENGKALEGANIVVVHEPSGTRYGAAARDNGQFNIPNMKIGGPYTVTASFIGYVEKSEKGVYLSLGQEYRIDFKLVEEAVAGEEVLVTAEMDEVFNSGRTGAATYIDPDHQTKYPRSYQAGSQKRW
jgi:hypothetical protein